MHALEPCTARLLTFAHIDLERVQQLMQFFKERCRPMPRRFDEIDRHITVNIQDVRRKVMHEEYTCLQDLYLFTPEPF